MTNELHSVSSMCAVGSKSLKSLNRMVNGQVAKNGEWRIPTDRATYNFSDCTEEIDVNKIVVHNSLSTLSNVFPKQIRVFFFFIQKFVVLEWLSDVENLKKLPYPSERIRFLVRIRFHLWSSGTCDKYAN